MSNKQIDFLVGDNPFHGISHLSQERARLRSAEKSPSELRQASQVVKLSLQNGAKGFMFSVSEITLSILKKINKTEKPELYAIVPYDLSSTLRFAGIAVVLLVLIFVGNRIFLSLRKS